MAPTVRRWFAAVSLMLFVCPQVRAGGFGILAQSGSALGNAFAGGAATAEDASVVWYNPAGMGKLDGFSLSGAVHAIKPSFRFKNEASSGAFSLPGTGEGGDGGDWGGVPQGYAVWAPTPAWRLGLGLNTPFGLQTEYEDGWRGQFTALKSKAAAYNINPSMAYRLSDALWLGAGISVQRFSAELTNFAGPLGNAKLDAHDTGWGFNVGALIDLSKDTRLGVAYRSAIRYTLSGRATFAAGGGVFDSGARTDLTVPESISVNLHTSLTPAWDLMAGATWTRWSRLQSLDVVRTSASALGGGGTLVTTLPFFWRDTVLYALGANFKPNETSKFRFGIALDPAASNDTYRTARLPDQRRVLMTIGAQVKPQNEFFRKWTFDVAYGYEFVKDAKINNSVTGVPGTLVGRFENDAHVLSFQMNYRH